MFSYAQTMLRIGGGIVHTVHLTAFNVKQKTKEQQLKVRNNNKIDVIKLMLCASVLWHECTSVYGLCVLYVLCMQFCI